MSVRSKSMPATATALVQSIWKNYFSLKGIGKGAVKEEDIAQEDDAMRDPDITECEAEVGGNGSEASSADENETSTFSYKTPTVLTLTGEVSGSQTSFLNYSEVMDDGTTGNEVWGLCGVREIGTRYSGEEEHIETGSRGRRASSWESRNGSVFFEAQND